MESSITIAQPADVVFAYVADPARAAHWAPQLMHEEMSQEPKLDADRDARTVRWTFAPAGEMRVEAAGEVTTLHLHITTDAAPPSDPTEPETPHDAAEHGVTAALRSLKSHLEGVGGGDPVLTTPDVPASLLGSTATRNPEI